MAQHLSLARFFSFYVNFILLSHCEDTSFCSYFFLFTKVVTAQGEYERSARASYPSFFRAKLRGGIIEFFLSSQRKTIFATIVWFNFQFPSALSSQRWMDSHDMACIRSSFDRINFHFVNYFYQRMRIYFKEHCFEQLKTIFLHIRKRLG